ncbi:hypothetical protein F5X96DRAFT_681981 [Biscogniauxia mediterranea]|nr:hypothetical protein F5X96DRAFT_681981 [Biscogniauxia mediterranea]
MPQVEQLFKAYFNHYISVICPSGDGDEVIEVGSPALQSHADVLGYVRSLCDNPTLSRDDFLHTTLLKNNTTPKEREYVAGIVVNVAFMVNCTSRGSRPVKWESDQGLDGFMKQSFTAELVQITEQQEKNLTKRYGIKIRPTDNLLEHLPCNPRDRTVKAFHQTGFLKAHLERSKNPPLDLDFQQSLKLGTLPPQLLFETLTSFHDILYPNFDRGGLGVEFVRPVTPDFTFIYWGDRLAKLHGVVKRPAPTNAFRNALTVAIIGLSLAALFGFLTLFLRAYMRTF